MFLKNICYNEANRSVVMATKELAGVRMILDEDKVAFDWVGTLVANDGNHFLTYEMIEVLHRELPSFSSQLDRAYSSKDREALIYHLDLIKESSMYCPMPKLSRHIDGILEHLDKDEFWPNDYAIKTCDELLGEVKHAVSGILAKHAKIKNLA